MKREACESEQDMRTNVPIKQQPVKAKTQPPDIQRRINAGWLRLWRKVYPNTPPPVEGGGQKPEDGRRKTEDGGAGDSSYRVCGPIQGDMKANSKVQRLKAKVQSRRPKPGRRAEVRGRARSEAETRTRRPPEAEVGGRKQEAGGGGLPLAVPVRRVRAGAAGDRLRRSPAAQGRQGRHDAQAGGHHRADPGAR